MMLVHFVAGALLMFLLSVIKAQSVSSLPSCPALCVVCSEEAVICQRLAYIIGNTLFIHVNCISVNCIFPIYFLKTNIRTIKQCRTVSVCFMCHRCSTDDSGAAAHRRFNRRSPTRCTVRPQQRHGHQSVSTSASRFVLDT